MDVLRDEHRLLMLLRFDVATTMVAELIEVIFKPTDIVTRAACTRFSGSSQIVLADLGGSTHKRSGSYCLAVRVYLGVADGSFERSGRRVLALMSKVFLRLSSLVLTDHGRCALVQHLVINSQRIACLHLSDCIAVHCCFAYLVSWLFYITGFLVQPLCCSGDCVWATGLCSFPPFVQTRLSNKLPVTIRASRMK